jgi:hypothetical protein
MATGRHFQWTANGGAMLATDVDASKLEGGVVPLA